MAKKMSYEELMQRVETIVSQLETGELPLEKSIEVYEEALQALTECDKIISSTIEKFEVIKVSKDEKKDENSKEVKDAKKLFE